jgi:hypothetical protein
LFAAEAAAGLSLRFQRAEDSIGHATLAVEWTTDFASWNTAAVGPVSSGPDASGVTISIDTAATPDRVTVLIPAATAPQGRIFARLKAGE